ncbi:zinc-finger homeodomain protein 6 [Senna tora]|uniref:Zinc-finger homeodomain protein 6 n=1 Tax=Senna tora TaxID=362788 RepID=A0A834TZ11_9FABA|nr:zinc-finger homeodomain protein 6 [Senna tora]
MPSSPPHQQLQRAARDPDPPSSSSPVAATGPNPRPPTTVRYRECLKNHAASMGGHVVDGCGEFMPSGDEGTPQSLRCAACDCHRNFHRKETEGEPQMMMNVPNYYTHHPPPTNKINRIVSPTSLQHHHQNRFSGGGLFPPMMMAFGGSGGAAAESSSEDLNMYQYNINAGGQGMVQPALMSSSSRKRFRTKFSQQQKERMMEFAEKLGWRIQKQDEQEVQQFCNQVGVKRQVFKVWMHNNKQAIKKNKQIEKSLLKQDAAIYGTIKLRASQVDITQSTKELPDAADLIVSVALEAASSAVLTAF